MDKLKDSAIEGDPKAPVDAEDLGGEPPEDGEPVELSDILKAGLGGPPWKLEDRQQAADRHVEALRKMQSADQDLAAEWATRLLTFVSKHADDVLEVYNELDKALAGKKPVTATMALLLIATHGLDQIGVPRGAIPTVIHWLPEMRTEEADG